MKKFTLVLLSLTITLTAGWWRTYGERWGEGKCLIAEENGYIVTGTQALSSNIGVLRLFKTDTLGNIVWSKTYGDSSVSAGGKFIDKTSDSGYILTGFLSDSIWLLRTDQDGDTIWTRRYVEGIGLCVHQTLDGGYILAGVKLYNPRYFFPSDLILIKTKSNGDTLWSKTYLLENWVYSWGNFVIQTSDENFMVTGFIADTFYGSKKQALWIIEIDSLGQIVWGTIQGDNNWDDDDGGASICQAKDSSYIVAGMIGGQSILQEVNFHGDVLWSKEYGRGICNCVRATSDGCYIVTGLIEDSATIFKVDSLGNQLWVQYYDGVFHYVNETDDRGFIITGVSDDGKTYLLKTDSLGLLAVEEPVTPPVTQDWQVLVPVGREIVLMFNESSPSLTLRVYDPSGRQVDELHVPQTGGTITWGDGFSPGVYFIRGMGDNPTTQKVVLVK